MNYKFRSTKSLKSGLGFTLIPFLCVILLGCRTPIHEPPVDVVEGPASVSVFKLNLRQQPGLSGKLIKTLGGGDRLVVVSRMTLKEHAINEPAEWAEVQMEDGQKGFVAAMGLYQTPNLEHRERTLGVVVPVTVSLTQTVRSGRPLPIMGQIWVSKGADRRLLASLDRPKLDAMIALITRGVERTQFTSSRAGDQEQRVDLGSAPDYGAHVAVSIHQDAGSATPRLLLFFCDEYVVNTVGIFPSDPELNQLLNLLQQARNGVTIAK